jgi:transcriptional regulator with XRE-family HTH domain
MAAALNVAEVFGARLREVRQLRGLTQVQVAERTGIAQNHISEIERGTRVPSVVTMLRLAAALECAPTDLVAVFDGVDLRTLLTK